MSTLASNAPTLLDVAKTFGPDGKVAKIAELLGQTNEILQDAVFKESNLEAGEQVSVRTGLPTPTWRLLNQGVAATKTTTAQITEQIGMLEDWSEIDQKVAEMNGNVKAYRLQEGMGHLEGMNQEMASTLMYGNQGTDPEQFTGFSPRYNDLSANNAQNILDAGGTGSDNSSIWLVGWGLNSVYKVYPKGSQAGLIHEDFGLQTIQTSPTPGIAGQRLRVYQERWQWNCGLVLKDWRFAVRIANIDISNLIAKSSAADLTDLMIKATIRIPSLSMVKPVFYMNRTVFQELTIQRRDDVQTGGSLTYDVVDGKRIPFFNQIPIKTVDALTETEAQIT